MFSNDAKLKIIVDAQDKTRGTFNSLNSQLQSTDRHTRNWTGSIKTAMTALAGLGVTAAGFLGYGVKIAADLETAEVGLTTLLGSAEQAAEVIERIKKEAVRTPFEIKGLTQATQLLTSVTKDGNKSIDTILDIGEALAAMGKGQAELDRIIVNLQQVGAIGHASMVDIKQFAYAGIPIFEMLSEALGGVTYATTDNSAAIAKNKDKLKSLTQQLNVAIARQHDFNKKTSEATVMANEYKIKNIRDQMAALRGETARLTSTNGQLIESQSGLDEIISEGGVTFEMLTEMFDKANDAGGRFFGAYENAAGTFNQSLSNLKDSMGLFMADIVESSGLFDALKVAMQGAADWLTNYRTNVELLQIKLRDFFVELDNKTGLVTLFKDAWANIVYMYQTELKPALLELWVTLQPYKPFLEALIQVFGTMLVIAIGGTITILGALAIVLIKVLTWITKIVDYVQGVFLGVWNAVTDAIAGTKGWVDELIVSLTRALDLIKRVLEFGSGSGIVKSALKKAGKVIGVNDAIIAPNGNVITTHPDDYLIATKNPSTLGGGIHITITGNTLLDRDAATKMGDLIMGRLRLSNQL